MKNVVVFAFFALFVLLLKNVSAQSLPISFPLIEENWRTKQVQGEANRDVSFTVRPIYQQANQERDSLSSLQTLLPGGKTGNLLSKQYMLLPLTLKQQYNVHHPYGWNDGSIIPAKGYQNQVSFGVFWKLGHLSVQVRPELVYAQNAGYTGFPPKFSDTLWARYAINYSNVIDAPERFGNRHYFKLFPGQSSVRFNFKKYSVGVSTENLWWGPGIRNSLIMSNNAPGFPHFTFNTTAPVYSPVGSFEGQLIVGLLQQSGFVPADTGRTLNGVRLYDVKPREDRYLNGLVLSWQPKWTKGLFLGISRVFYENRSQVASSLNGYLPVIGRLFKGSLDDALKEDSLNRDQLVSLFFRLLLPKENAELYAEFGRNDHAGSTRDLALEPEHSRAYLIGFRKLFATKGQRSMELMFELANLQLPSTVFVRDQQSWYTHNRARDGYTQLGQVIGAGIGPGANSQSIGLNWIKGLDKKGILFERVTHNNDFYYAAFSQDRDYWRHWVDLSLLLNKSWQHKHFLYDARLSLIYAMNYQWQSGLDKKNLQAYFSVSYLF